jgi:TrkA domain protein
VVGRSGPPAGAAGRPACRLTPAHDSGPHLLGERLALRRLTRTGSTAQHERTCHEQRDRGAGLPGIGRRYRLAGRDGGSAVVVVVHHSGRRDLYVMAADADAPQPTLALTDRQARTLGAVLSGAYFAPAVVEEMEAVIGDILIDWMTLRPDSPGADRSIAELEIRRRTRMTVAAVARDNGTIIAPEPTEVLRAGDRLVVVGRPEDLAAFTQHVIGAASG